MLKPQAYKETSDRQPYIHGSNIIHSGGLTFSVKTGSINSFDNSVCLYVKIIPPTHNSINFYWSLVTTVRLQLYTSDCLAAQVDAWVDLLNAQDPALLRKIKRELRACYRRY